MAWSPNQDQLNQVGQLLQACADPSNHERHVQALQMLDSAKREMPDFGCYMLLVFCKMPDAAMELRQLAGLELKNTIKLQQSRMDPKVLDFVKVEIAAVLSDQDRRCRMIAAQIITTLLFNVRVPLGEVLMALLPVLGQEGNAHHGALTAFILICEDHADTLCRQEHADLLNGMIAKFVSLLTSSLPETAAGAIRCFILRCPNALIINLQQFLEGMLALHKDQSSDVRKEICQSLCLLVEVKADFLRDPNICKFVIEFLLWTTEHDSDYDVKKEACEFWSSLCENEDVPKDVLKPYLSRLTLVLLNGMVYSEDELNALGDELDSTPDRDTDINPAALHYTSKHHVAQEEEEDEEEDEEEGGGGEWTLRKCSAAGLDVIANHYRDDILDALLPHIHTKLTDQDWKTQESAVLAVGALSEGCEQGLIQRNYLPDFIVHLISNLLLHDKPLVRSITCWTLSRYSRWCSSHVNENGVNGLIEPLVGGLLKCMLDPSKKVQEAACSAVATLEEEAGSTLSPFVPAMLNVFAAAFQRYQARNLVILYDACGTLADAIGSELNKPEYVNVLLQPLMARWAATQDTDESIFPLLECLASVVQALGMGFAPSAPAVFQRCDRLIQMGLQSQMNEETAMQDEFIVCPLDLISGLAEGLGGSIESLVAQSQIVPSLLMCCQHMSSEVRQSAFALVGDLAKNALPHLRPALHQIVELVQQNMNPEHVSVCNNSIWAVGEIAVRVGQELEPYLPAMCVPLMQILARPQLNKSLLENATITLGRFGYVCPQLVASNLPQFVQPWCKVLSRIRDDIEKEHAFRGLVKMALINPQGLIDSFDSLPADLRKELSDMLTWFKQNLEQAGQWSQLYGRVPLEVQQVIHQNFGVAP